MRELEVVLCGGGAASEVENKLHLYFVECCKVVGAVSYGKMGHEFTENLCEKKEYIPFMMLVA